jgi:hypothetical protein
MPTSTVLIFGFEIELLVKPKPSLNEYLEHHGFDHKIKPTQENTAFKKRRAAVYYDKEEAAKEANRTALRKAVAEVLTQCGVETKVRRATGGYTDWSIRNESTLNEAVDSDQTGGGYCKLQTRVLPRLLQHKTLLVAELTSWNG